MNKVFMSELDGLKLVSVPGNSQKVWVTPEKSSPVPCVTSKSGRNGMTIFVYGLTVDEERRVYDNNHTLRQVYASTCVATCMYPVIMLWSSSSVSLSCLAEVTSLGGSHTHGDNDKANNQLQVPLTMPTILM